MFRNLPLMVQRRWVDRLKIKLQTTKSEEALWIVLDLYSFGKPCLVGTNLFIGWIFANSIGISHFGIQNAIDLFNKLFCPQKQPPAKYISALFSLFYPPIETFEPCWYNQGCTKSSTKTPFLFLIISSALIPQHYYKLNFLSTWATKSCSGFCHVEEFTYLSVAKINKRIRR